MIPTYVLPLGAVTDVIKIGGKTYSVDALLDKVLVASGPVAIYSGSDFTKPIYIVKAGQSIGRIYSYIKPSAANGGRAMLSFDSPTEKWPNGVPKSYYAGADNIDTTVLKDQGVLNLQEQVAKEAEEKLKNDSPMEYYIKKYAGKVLLTAGVIWGVVELGKVFIAKKTTPAMAGPGKKTKRKKK